LRNRLTDINEAITYAKDEFSKAYKRKQRKEMWGGLSFIFEPYWVLELNYKRTLAQLDLLNEYRDIIVERLNK